MSLKNILGKVFTLLIYLRHPNVRSQYRWFLRFFYLGHLNQVHFFLKDYLIKKPYKEVKFFGEFQQELLYVLPHAYWHYCNGTLKKTISSRGTSPFYFFSTHHEERFITRKWKGNYNINFPNGPHNHRLSSFKWKSVPLKEQYKNDEFTYEKPILIVANRYNSEWGNEPISFFDLRTLEILFNILNERYQVVYNRPGVDEITNDNSDIKALEDKEWIRINFPEVIILSDVYVKNRNRYSCFNELQLKMYANCDNFISIHGGTATLASYFGGKNIIFSKRGHEHQLNEFINIFSRVANTQIFHVKTYDELIDVAHNEFIQ